MVPPSEPMQEPRFELDLGSDEVLTPPASPLPAGGTLPVLDDWLEQPARPAAPAAPVPAWIDLAALDLPDLDLPGGPPAPAPGLQPAPTLAAALDGVGVRDEPAWDAPPPSPSAAPAPILAQGPAPAASVKVGPLDLPADAFNRFLAEAEEALAQFDRLALGRVAHPAAEAARAASRLAGDAAALGLDDTAALAAALGAAWSRLEPAPPPDDTQGLIDEALRLLGQRLHQHAAGVLRPLPAGLLDRLAALAPPPAVAPPAGPLPPPPAALWAMLEAPSLAEGPTQALRAGLDRLSAALVGLRLEAPAGVEPAAWQAVREAQQALRATALRCEEAWLDARERAIRLDAALPGTLDALAARLAAAPGPTAFAPMAPAAAPLALPPARLEALARILARWGEAQRAARRLLEPVRLDAEPEGPLRLSLPPGADLVPDPALAELADALEALGLALDAPPGLAVLRIWGWDAPSLLPMRAGRREGRLVWLPQAWLQATGLPALGRPSPAQGFEPDWSPAQAMRWTPPPAVLAGWPGLRGVARDAAGRTWPVSRPIPGGA